MSQHSHYIPKSILGNFCGSSKYPDHIFLANFTVGKIGHRNIKSAFYRRGLYSDQLEEQFNIELENKMKAIIGMLLSNSNGAVQLTSEQDELLKKYLICQEIRTVFGSDTLINEPNDPYKILKETCPKGKSGDEYWEDAISEILTKPWKELYDSKNAIVREFVRTEDSCYRFVIHTDNYLMINDFGMVREVTSGLSEKQQGDVRRYVSKEYGLNKYEDLSRQGRQNCLVFSISSHHAIIKMPIIWGKLFQDWKNASVFAANNMVSPLLQDIAEHNTGKNLPLDYSSKTNKMLIVEAGPESADMINAMNIIQCKQWLGLEDPDKMKEFFELYETHSNNNNRCRWILNDYDWDKDLS